MALFKYKGMNAQGNEVKSTITSESLALAKNKLRGQGIMLIEIKEQKADTHKKKSTISIIKSISISDIALMTRQLATLLKAKIQIVEALSALVDQTENPHMKAVLAEIKQKVNEGSSLAKAFSDYPNVFTNVYINMVDAGESSANLEIVLLRLAEFTENQVKLKNRIKNAMIYPLLMATFGMIMMIIIFTFVIPKITKIFVQMKRTLPIPTQIAILISDIIKGYWYILIIGAFLIYWLFKKYIHSKSGEKRWHKFLLATPLLGNLITMINVSRFCSTLATLLNSGVPILTSIKIIQNLISNVHMKAAVSDAKLSVAEGASMTGPLVKSGLFPSMVTHMILLGERSGELEPMLKIIAENYEDQVNTRLSGLTSVLEPIMLIVMGCAVAFIVFSVVMPMMELNTIR